MRRHLLGRGMALLLAGGMAGCATPEFATPGTPASSAGVQAMLTLRVTARQYAWTFEYPGGATSEELHLPSGSEVALVLMSRDVIHALAIPAFRFKEDAVPGRESRVTVRAGAAGAYDARCAEFCGPGHSGCAAKVIVHDPEAFDRWLTSRKPK